MIPNTASICRTATRGRSIRFSTAGGNARPAALDQPAMPRSRRHNRGLGAAIRHVAPPTNTRDLLTDITHAIKRQFTYRRSLDPGVQTPLETLQLGTGTCRDFALFMIEAVRSLGLAARFVSGYLHVPARSEGRRRRRLHPCLGAGLSAERRLGRIRSDQRHRRQPGLIRVAVAREPRQAVPLCGTYTGLRSDSIGMKVDIDVIAQA